MTRGVVRAATPMESVYAKKAPPMLDTHHEPTGWLQVEYPNGEGVVLLSFDGKQVVPFPSENPRNGTACLRAFAEAQCYAMDHPYRPAVAPEHDNQPLLDALKARFEGIRGVTVKPSVLTPGDVSFLFQGSRQTVELLVLLRSNGDGGGGVGLEWSICDQGHMSAINPEGFDDMADALDRIAEKMAEIPPEILVGDYVRSYDFPHSKDCYLEGHVRGISSHEGCPRYEIETVRRVWEGLERPIDDHERRVLPPVNGIPTMGRGYTQGVVCVKPPSPEVSVSGPVRENYFFRRGDLGVTLSIGKSAGDGSYVIGRSVVRGGHPLTGADEDEVLGVSPTRFGGGKTEAEARQAVEDVSAYLLLMGFAEEAPKRQVKQSVGIGL